MGWGVVSLEELNQSMVLNKSTLKSLLTRWEARGEELDGHP